MRPFRLALLCCVALTCATTAPASPKPCRDKDGRVVACAKPKKAPPARCKDDRGRFVACENSEAKPKPKA